MAQTTATQRGSEQAVDKNALRPFHVNVPEAELTELRKRINNTGGLNEKRSRMQPKACSSRRLKRSLAIGRQSTTGASARRN